MSVASGVACARAPPYALASARGPRAHPGNPRALPLPRDGSVIPGVIRVLPPCPSRTTAHATATRRYHHSHNKGSYGSFTKFWDWACGTDKEYNAWLLKRATLAKGTKAT